MMKKTVLLIAKHSAKADALVRFWPHENWDLRLYTYRRKEWYRGMSAILGDKWITHIPGPGKNGNINGSRSGHQKSRRIKQRYRQKTRGLRKFIHHRLLRLWDQQLLKWALPSLGKTKSIVDQTQPDLVLSIYEPLATNYIARRVAAHKGIPWIAYFRDHCTTYNELYRVPLLWQLQTAYDVHLHAPMDRLVGVSSEFVDILSEFYKVPKDRAYVVTGGYDDNDLPAEIRQNCIDRRKQGPAPVTVSGDQPRKLMLSYIGALYGHRVEPLVVLLDALQVLRDKGVACQLQLLMNKASHFLPAAVQEQIDRAKAQGLILDLGSERIPHAQALKMSDAADVNFVLEGMRPPSLPIGKYLREAGIGVDCNTVKEVVDRISEVWNWVRGNNAPDWYAPVNHAIDQYSYKGMATKMNTVLEQTYAESTTTRKAGGLDFRP
jgi:glycosyltransferase involved in cell wall biosynthesis